MRIVSAKVTDGFIVRLHLSNGTTVDRDFAFVHGPVFDSIWQDPQRFRRVRVADGGLTWPGEVDFCTDAVLWGGPRHGKQQPVKHATIGARGALIGRRFISCLNGRRAA